MTKIAQSLFGGGGDKDAKKEAEKSRQLQAVANDRQLAELNRNDKVVAANRKAPRGRRLFEDGSEALPGTLA